MRCFTKENPAYSVEELKQHVIGLIMLSILTEPAGIDYFNDRYNPGNPQHVDQSEVEAMVRLIRYGGGSDWVRIG